MKFDILKISLSLIVIGICCNLITSLSSKIGMQTNLKSGMNMNLNNKILLKNFLEKHKNRKNSMNTKLTELNRMQSKILFSGWLKYFKYLDDDTTKRPKEFFKNPQFQRDSKRKHEEQEVKKFL
jgi:hypothetical protein